MSPPYPVVCHALDCSAAAGHKIAARWSDGFTHELKTYSLCCPACLPSELASAHARRGRCRLAPGETLGEPEVFPLGSGTIPGTFPPTG